MERREMSLASARPCRSRARELDAAYRATSYTTDRPSGSTAPDRSRSTLGQIDLRERALVVQDPDGIRRDGHRYGVLVAECHELGHRVDGGIEEGDSHRPFALDPVVREEPDPAIVRLDEAAAECESAWVQRLPSAHACVGR